ncbi:hypothetical protein [Pseudomonas canadensis]|uniref:hypothetical protein n=1 Tax=Pseudomonas canadensis TaxID=915099 RepID=UPI002732FACE|nr:hypothetical protein [Pseudomonas canadensis]WLH32666.1 hypothetical protein PSH56_13355 [Pseudomonas canadensis]
MAFQITGANIGADGRLLVSLENKQTGSKTQVWVKPTSPIPELTLSEIEKLAKAVAANEHSC